MGYCWDFFVSYIYNRSDLILGQSKSFISQISQYSNHNRIEYFPSWAEPIFEISQNNYFNKKQYNQNFNILFAGNIGEAQNFPAILDAILASEKVNPQLIPVIIKIDKVKKFKFILF